MSSCTVPLRRIALDWADGPFGSALKSDHYADTGARVVRLGNIGEGVFRHADEARIDLNYWEALSRHHVHAGDVLIAGLGDDRNPVGRATVAPALGPAMVKADCFRVTLDPAVADPRFVVRWLCSAVGLGTAKAQSDGSTRQRLTLDKALSLPVAVPSLERQRFIADLLDDATARIDRLVDLKHRQLSLLHERRAAVVELAAIGGKAAPRRESRLPWAASIPAHWTTVKLNLVARLGSGHTPSRDHPEWWIHCTVPWITTGEVSQMRSDRIEEISETREMISELGLANSSATVHPTGTVVLCRTAASAGYSAIMGMDMATSQDFATWTCGPLLRPRYLLLCLRAMRPDLLGRLAMGSTHKTIYMPDIEAIRIPLPPVEEQDEIVERTWRQLRAIDKAVDAIEQHIGLLQERKQALITAAVTGQLDVAQEIAEEAS